MDVFAQEQAHDRRKRLGRRGHLADITWIEHPYDPPASVRFQHDFIVYEFASTAVADGDQCSSVMRHIPSAQDAERSRAC